jgi:hypothetical protein
MLVFPGVGHLYLKKYVPGLLLSIGAATATYFIVSSAVQAALEILENIHGGSISLETGSITELVTQQLHASEEPTNIAMIALFAFWIIGILDSFRVGRMLENFDRAEGEDES